MGIRLRALHIDVRLSHGEREGMAVNGTSLESVSVLNHHAGAGSEVPCRFFAHALRAAKEGGTQRGC